MIRVGEFSIAKKGEFSFAVDIFALSNIKL